LDDIVDEILKDCFWEYNFSKDDIYKLAKDTNKDKKEFLFSKILSNSTNLIKSMKIFKKDDLIELINSYKLPRFNQEFLKRRLNMLEFYFLDKPLEIDELKWVA
jgi:type III secretory pathway component EscR